MTKHIQQAALQAIGRNIRRWREFREMKGEELAQKIGINKASLSNIENGKTDVSLSKLQEIARVLELNIEQLISTNPQSIITFTQSTNSSNVNYGTQNNSVDATLLEDLRQQLKTKDEQIKFLQTQFPTK